MRVDSRRGRDVAGAVGECCGQGFAVGLRRGQHNFEGAIGADRAGTNDVAVSILEGDGGSRFTFTGDGGAIGTDRQVSRSIGRGDVPLFDDDAGGIDVRWRGHIAGGIGQRRGEGFTVGFRGVKRDHEGAIGADCTGTDHVTVGILDGDGGVGFAFAADSAAVGADGKIGRGRRCGGVAGVDAGRCRDVARRVGQGGRQGFAVGLCWVQGDDEGAIGADRAGANHIAVGILDGDRGVGLTLAADGAAIGTDGQIARCGGSRGVASGDGAGSGDIARRVSEADLDCFAVGLRGVQVDLEVAISAYGARADDATIGVLDRHRRTRLPTTTE